jgi:hypothetical protein
MISANASYGNIAQYVDSHWTDFENIESTNLFHVHDHGEGHESETAAGYSEGELSNGTVLDKDASHAAFLEMNEPEDYLKITLPQEEGDDITLWLYRT